jgi:glycosyltransferase involved in cell wall biosynthesis
LRTIHSIFGVKRVLYLNSIKGGASGHKHRTEKWVKILNDNGIRTKNIGISSVEKFQSFLSAKSKIPFYVVFIFKRYFQILYSINFSTVIVTREVLIYNDYGNAFYEKLLRSLHYNLILDFDDDVGAEKRKNDYNNTYSKLLLADSGKFEKSFRYYDKFIPGSNYLKELLLKTNKNLTDDHIIVVPTVVDYHLSERKNYVEVTSPIKFGWVGTIGNLRYLDLVVEALEKVANLYDIELLIISGSNYQPSKKVSFPIKFIPWDIDKEIENIKMIDIGLMPLNFDDIEKGKCGFKLIQYMGLGIVSLASAITINKEIIDDKVDGYLVPENSSEGWYNALINALENQKMFGKIGKQAQEKIKNQYSYSNYKENYINFVAN